MQYLIRQLAADYLTKNGVKTTAQGLADRASDGTGPAYSIINGRACYTASALDAWLEAQAARPVLRRRERQGADEAA
jgi:hypothetical protein